MSNENLHPIFKDILDTINPEQNKQKEFKQSVYEKAALKCFHEDVLNDNVPEVKLTPECEAAYIRAFLSGADYGLETAIGKFSAIQSPTLER